MKFFIWAVCIIFAATLITAIEHAGGIQLGALIKLIIASIAIITARFLTKKYSKSKSKKTETQDEQPYTPSLKQETSEQDINESLDIQDNKKTNTLFEQNSNENFIQYKNPTKENTIFYRSPHFFNFEGGDLLSHMGATWFVAYSYFYYIDDSYRGWEKVKTYTSRISVFEKTKKYHVFWLSQVLSMDDKRLNTNTLEIGASETKKMTREILQKALSSS